MVYCQYSGHVFLLKLTSDHVAPQFSLKAQVISMIYKTAAPLDLIVSLTPPPTASPTYLGHYYLRPFPLILPSAWKVLYQLATWLAHLSPSVSTKRYFLRSGFLYHPIKNYTL